MITIIHNNDNYNNNKIVPSYKKIDYVDNSGSHQIELGWLHAVNLLPNEGEFKDILSVQETRRTIADRDIALRIICRFKPNGQQPDYLFCVSSDIPCISLSFYYCKSLSSTHSPCQFPYHYLPIINRYFIFPIILISSTLSLV